MDAVDFIKTKERMTKSCRTCEGCSLSFENNGKRMFCDTFVKRYPEEGVRIVEEWGKEHPLKTRRQVFFEKFPNAPRDEYDYPKICPNTCGLGDVSNLESTSITCIDCWDKPAPDEYQD